jgi:hypothetical protein
MAVSSHRSYGTDAVHRALRGAVMGSWGGVAFFSAVIMLAGDVQPAIMYLAVVASAVTAGIFAVGLQSIIRAHHFDLRLHLPVHVR